MPIDLKSKAERVRTLYANSMRASIGFKDYTLRENIPFLDAISGRLSVIRSGDSNE